MNQKITFQETVNISILADVTHIKTAEKEEESPGIYVTYLRITLIVVLLSSDPTAN